MFEDEIPVGKAKDLRGQKFGRLTVLYRVKSQGNNPNVAYWKCICECKNTTVVRSDSLRNGTIRSCGCLAMETKSMNGLKRRKDFSGMTFNRITLLKNLNRKDNKGCYLYEGICACGTQIPEISGSLVSRGMIKSCGCLRTENIKRANSAKLEGLIFGKLTVIKEAYRKNYSVYWECLCACGNITHVSSSQLLSGKTSSCGCIKSKGELKATQILRDKNIAYNIHYHFESCRFPWSNYLAEFDIYLPDLGILIEIDGIQHYQSVDYFGGKEGFQAIQKHDVYKNQWCRENNIPLIRIPYWKFDTLCIEDLMLETTKFRVV